MKENTNKKNLSQVKGNILFIIFYFIIAASLIASIFCKFLKTNSFEIGFADILSFSGSLRMTAILTIVNFSIMALMAIICIIERGTSFTGQKEKDGRFGIILIMVNIVLMVICLPSLISAQFHLLKYYDKATITIAFVTNIILPLLFCILLVVDQKKIVKNEFFCNIEKQKLYQTTFVYPILSLLSLMVLCMPVYQYKFANGTGGIYTEFFSLYGATVHTGLLKFRSSLLLVASALLALIMFVVQLGILSAHSKSDLKKEKVYRNIRIVSVLAMLVFAIYCLPSVINFMTECRQYLDGLSESVYINKSLGFSHYAMLIVPVLTTLCCAVDGVNEYLSKKPVKKPTIRVIKKSERPESNLWLLIRVILSSAYIVILMIILLALALPYAKYGLYDVENVDFFSYITLYSGVEKGYINGMPATNIMFVYAIITVALAVTSLVLLYFSKKKVGKKANVVIIVGKTICMIVFICAFAWLSGTISFYYEKFTEIAIMSDSYVAIGIAGDLLAVATIGYLVAVCVDFVIYGYKFLQERK